MTGSCNTTAHEPGFSRIVSELREAAALFAAGKRDPNVGCLLEAAAIIEALSLVPSVATESNGCSYADCERCEAFERQAQRWQRIADQRAIEVADLKHDLERAMKNHNADLNAPAASARVKKA